MTKKRPFIFEDVRKDFPLLQKDKNYIYVDNAATTQKPQQVIDSMTNYYSQYNANVHRGIHKLSEQSTDAFENVRTKIANFIGAEKEEIVYTYGTTHGINTLAFGFEHELQKGDEIVISEVEHHANIVPWQEVCKKTGAILRIIPITPDFKLDYSKAQDIINSNTKILSITHASNVLGTRNDVKTLIEYAKSQNKKCITIIDGAQEIAHGNVNVKNIGCDAYVFSAHKIYGPTGVGVLYLKKQLFNEIKPLMYGGSMIEDVSFEKTTYAKGFHKLEAGTPPIAEVIGFGSALDYISSFDEKDISKHLNELTQYFLDSTIELGEDFKLYGPKEYSMRNPVFSFTFADIHSNDLTTFLDEYGIAVRSGHHCAIPLHKKLELNGTTRISLSIYNSKEDIDEIIKALKEIKELFQAQ